MTKEEAKKYLEKCDGCLTCKYFLGEDEYGFGHCELQNIVYEKKPTYEELQKIMNQFNNILKSYEMDKKFGQLSIESVCHLFPNEVIIIKDYITNLQKENEEFKLELSGYRSAILKNDNLLGLQQRIDKAIEFIKEWQSFPHTNGSTHDELRNLLDILGGDE